MKDFIKKGDIIIVIAGMAIAVVLWIFCFNAKSGSYVKITSNGVTKSYALDVNREISVQNKENNGKNHIVIENGFVYMKEADCPDLICVHHKAINKNHETIICLPNEVYLEVVSGLPNETDN